MPASNTRSRSGAALPTIRRLLLCEGPDDKEFFQAFIEQRQLSHLGFRVHHNGNEKNQAGGITQFGGGLLAHFTLKNGWSSFKDVLLVGDNNDSDPIDINFKSIKRQAHSILGFTPNAPGELAVNGRRRVMILMVPANDENGHLESLCRKALSSVDDHVTRPLEHYYYGTRVNEWPSICRRDEMWLRANLAVRCQSDPGISLRNLFSKPTLRHLIPWDDPAFQYIYEALISFSV